MLEFWREWRDAGHAPIRAMLEINGISVQDAAAPAVEASNTTVTLRYNGAAQVMVRAFDAEGGPARMSLSGGNGTAGGAATAPAFANMTYRYDNATGATAALISLRPNASDAGVHVLNVTAVSEATGLSNHTLILVNVTDPVPPYFGAVPWDLYVEAAGPLTPVNATALGVRAHDEADPRPRLEHSPPGPLAVGGHYIWWTVTDASNNTASARMYLVVQDTLPPVFANVADAAAVFAASERPAALYAPPNATDLVDGDVAVRCSPPPGSPIALGLTRVECSASDSRWNTAYARFWLNATLDGPAAPPRIAAAPGDASVEVAYNGTGAVVVAVNATGAAGPARMSLSGWNGTEGGNESAGAAPAFANMTYRYDNATGATAALISLRPNASDVGVHVLNVTAVSEATGLSNHTLILVNVTDPVPPELYVPASAAIEATGRLTAINAAALGVHAHDEADAEVQVRHAPHGPLGLGRHLVTWNASDSSGNTATASMLLTVQDTTPPGFPVLANLTLVFAPGVQPVADYTVPYAYDAVDGAVHALCWPQPDSPIGDGVTTVACFASDGSGNAALARFSINATR